MLQSSALVEEAFEYVLRRAHLESARGALTAVYCKLYLMFAMKTTKVAHDEMRNDEACYACKTHARLHSCKLYISPNR